MPNTAIVATATKQQAQQANNKFADFKKQMEQIINARQLEAMRGSLGF